MSATCDHCNQEMAPGKGCTQTKYDDFPDGVARERIPYDGDGRHCHDCNVRRGQLHHPGCDMERCPACGGQAIACDCVSEEEDDEDDE